MNTTGWILMGIGSLFAIFFGIVFIKDFIWNQRLKGFHQKHQMKVPRVPILYWIKRAYGLSLSSLAVVAVVACGQFELPVRNNTYLSAKAVGNEQTLLSLLDTTQNYWREVDDVMAPEAGLDGAFDQNEETRDFIDTNVQVEGVMEADIVKTDGYTIYYASRYQNKVRILDVNDDGTVFIQEDLDLGNLYTDSLYLTETQLIVIGYTYEYFYFAPEIDEEGMSLDYWFGGYTVFTGSVRIYNRETMEIDYELETDTNFYQHRLIDDALYLISNKYVYENDLVPHFKETEDERVSEADLSYDDIYYFDDVPVYGMTVLTVIDLSEYTYDAEAFLGQVHQMYASLDAIYTTSTVYRQMTEDEPVWEMWNHPYTHIIKYDIDAENKTFNYAASGFVDGYIQEQYWMDAYEDTFRIVTTTWGTSINRLFILEENEETETLDVIGSITEGIGKEGANESVKAVRFNKNRVNIVTFETIDPLYTIDLSNPENPYILPDAIEEEGYNTYLHVWNEDHLLIGIGYDGNFQLKLGAYDTSENNPNPGEPLTTYHLAESDLEGVYTYVYSEVLYNPKAIMVDVEKGIFAFPVSSYSYHYNEFYGYDSFSYQSLYYVFYINFDAENLDDIISEPVIISHDEFHYYSGIDRGVYIDGVVYTLSYAQMVSYDLLTQQVIEKITFEGMDIYDPYDRPVYEENPDGSTEPSEAGDPDEAS